MYLCYNNILFSITIEYTMKYIEIREKNGAYSYFYYIPNFLDTVYCKQLTTWLDYMNDFNKNKNYNDDQIIRYQKWYQKKHQYFCKEWKVKYTRWNAFSYDSVLAELESYIQTRLKEEYFNDIGIHIPDLNSVLIQKYIDGNHYISAHRDTDMSFGKTPTIVNISLGDSRDIICKRVMYNGSNKKMSKIDKENKHLSMKITLKEGSIFIMAGESQQHWTHQIDKESNKQTRYSLTFRELL